MIGMTLLEQFIVGEAGEGAIFLAAQPWIFKQVGDQFGGSDLQTRREMQSLLQVHRIVIDEQNTGGA